MPFPYIDHIDYVYPHIEGRPEFTITQKDGYRVVKYNVQLQDTFQDPFEDGISEDELLGRWIRRECRGMVFDQYGELISRPYHKFKNLNESAETQLNVVDLTKPHVIMDKLDGSMIHPIPFYDGDNVYRVLFRLATKAGITDVSNQAEQFLWNGSNSGHVALIQSCLVRGQTPIFEWVSRQQRIVVDYPTDSLILTAIRSTIDGEYMLYEEMVEVAGNFGVPVVKALRGGESATSNVIQMAKTLEGQEGWVLRFDDGEMVKVKGEWYVLRHRSKDMLTREKDVLSAIVNDQVDDIVPLLPDEDVVSIRKFQIRFWKAVNCYCRGFVERIQPLVEQFKGDRKGFALAVNCVNSIQGPLERAIAFKAFDDIESVDEAVLAVIAKNLSTQTKVDTVRFMWDGIRWDYRGQDE